MKKIQFMLDHRPDLQHLLFRRGFLISKIPIDNKRRCQFPFYGNWDTESIDGYYFYTHRDARFAYTEVDGVTFFIEGHCYNPFTMEYDEQKCLNDIASTYNNKDEFQNKIDELTGVFLLGWIQEGKISFIVDPSGMQSACYGIIDGNFVMTSHPQIVCDIFNLSMSNLTTELVHYKWYPRVMGPYLPCDMTPFDELKRVVPNIRYEYNPLKCHFTKDIEHARFYPLKDIQECTTDEDYHNTIHAAADILKNGAELVSRKWKRPGISLTGGIDSNTTFAAANGHYDDFETFSYMSALKESIDVKAANEIAEKFKTRHSVYNIPESSELIVDYDLKAEILAHNCAYVALQKGNELRKRMYLEENASYDIEVKSWVSETIRAYWYKHYGRKTMPPLSGKLFRNLYKIFIGDRKLARKIDLLFEEYIEKFEYQKIPLQYPPADMHYNEVTWGSWGGMNISEMKYCFDITFLYNNRKFLDLLFRVPLDKRISDQHHLDMKKYLNKELFDMNIRVVNMHETKTRAFLLNVIFTINTWLPF